MYIKQKRIQNIEFVEKHIINGKICIGVPASDENIRKSGIDISIEETSVLPSPTLGKNCRRNVMGEWRVDKNGIKAPRHTHTVYWKWHQWTGGGDKIEMGDWRDIHKMCYPRTFIEPFNIEIHLLSKNNKKFLVSVLKIDNFETCKEEIKITLNMFLEIYGYCYLYDENFSIEDSKLKRCQWIILPSGEGSQAYGKDSGFYATGKKKTDCFYQFRLDIMHGYLPGEVYIGKNGFTGYYAFIFDKVCIFESGKYGNATYVTKSHNWEDLSQMSKQQLSDSNNVIRRFKHNASWFKEVDKFMKRLNNTAPFIQAQLSLFTDKFDNTHVV